MRLYGQHHNIVLRSPDSPGPPIQQGVLISHNVSISIFTKVPVSEAQLLHGLRALCAGQLPRCLTSLNTLSLDHFIAML